MTTPNISIIMAVYNRLDITRLCLPTLDRSLAGREDIEIIIVDDCSTDGTREFLQTLPAPYRVILREDKGNFAINNNLGVRASSGGILVFLNNDTELPPDWLDSMLDTLDTCPGPVGMVGNIQRLPATGRIDHLGVVFPPWLTPLHYGQHRRRLPADLPRFSEWNAVTAACCLCSRETFEAVGGFDEAYVNGCEDIDLCLKMKRAGYRHYTANESIILHHKGASPGRKTHNHTNLTRLKTIWGDYITRELVPLDRRRAAASYLRGVLARPTKANFTKTLQSLLIQTRLR
ncbi:MAG: glycosyltransferase family 2 protein [Verrucomicrobiota bacterium]